MVVKTRWAERACQAFDLTFPAGRAHRIGSEYTPRTAALRDGLGPAACRHLTGPRLRRGVKWRRQNHDSALNIGRILALSIVGTIGLHQVDVKQTATTEIPASG